MTNWGYDEDNTDGLDNVNEINGPKALRDAYTSLKKQNDELNQKLTSFLEREEKQRVASVFQNLGVPGAESVYQGPADPEAAKAWVESMKQVFGGNQGVTPPVAEEPVAPAVPPSMQAQFERMTAAGQDGTPLGNVEAAAGAIGDASNTADIIAAFQRMQRM